MLDGLIKRRPSQKKSDGRTLSKDAAICGLSGVQNLGFPERTAEYPG